MLGLAAALRYREVSDEAAERLEKLVSAHGEVGALTQMTDGLDEQVISTLASALKHLDDL